MSPPQHPRDYLPLLQADPWYSQLDAKFARALIERATLREFSDRQCVFLRGASPCGLYCVLQGGVRITGVTEAGKEALLACLEPTTWFGEISLLDGLPRTHDAYAQGATVLLQIPQVDVLDLLQVFPACWRQIAVLVSLKLRLVFLAMEDQALLPAPLRLARRLLVMASAALQRRASGSSVFVALSQEQLAMMLSLSRQTANQILKDMQARGLIDLAYGRIEILDVEQLQAYAQVTERELSLLPRMTSGGPG